MDTNALMMPVECDVRVFEELERVLDGGSTDYLVPEAVQAELARLADGAGEAATAASVGLDLARERCRSVEHDAASADEAVIEVGTRPDVTHVVTNDRPVRERLLARGVSVISLRAGNKLTVTQP